MSTPRGTEAQDSQRSAPKPTPSQLKSSENLRNVMVGLSALITSVAIPLLGLYYTDQQKKQQLELEKNHKDRELGKNFIEIGTKILSEKPTPEAKPLRIWAIEMINRYAEVKIPEEVEQALLTYQSLFESPVPQTDSLRQKFFKGYQTAFGPIKPEAKDGITRIFDFIAQGKEIRDVRWVAYVLATLRWESNETYHPTVELGSDESLEAKYGMNTVVGKNMGNTEPGDGARYKGRGYVQIVGKSLYQQMGQLLNIDLVENPDAVLEPEIAYQILLRGMLDGMFTGKKLGDYVGGEKTDYVNARRVVNPADPVPPSARIIAAAADKFEAVLRQSLPATANAN